MTGLELSRAYYEAIGRERLAKAFPELSRRMAVGLAGEGSECFGFDDALSRDHDWGASFCIWLTEDDFRRYGDSVQAAYDALPHPEGFPPRSTSPEGSGRVGGLCIPDWYRRYTGCPEGPGTLLEWLRIPEPFLATATNGALFCDPLGCFSAVRERLLGFYPEDVRLKKLAARAAVMAQSGQYNYPRCRKRGEPVAAQLALAEFIRASLSMAYLLNRRYMPFYKWAHRGLKALDKLPRLYDQLAGLAEETGDVSEAIEGICRNMAAELFRQGLTDHTDPFLQSHCAGITQRIQDQTLRRMHVMKGE